MKTRIGFEKTINGKKISVNYDPYLFSQVAGLVMRREKNWHGLILITGEVGDGKSSLAEGICGLDSYITGKKYDLDNIVFSTTEFEKLTDCKDNYMQPIKYDEAIEGATNQDMARSNKGISFKKKIIQKRKKKHLYVMCIDELEEYSWKLVKMANIWIHVKSHGLSRGYFDIYTKPEKIKNKWLNLKNKQYSMANKIFPDKINCTYMDYSGIFVDDDEYQEKKDKETSSTEKKDPKNDRETHIMNMINKGYKQQEIASIFGLSRSYIGDIKSKMSSQ